MRSFITKSLEIICQIGIVLIVIGSAVSAGTAGGVVAGLIGAIGGLIFSVILFGALFLLMDIADNTRRTAEAVENRG